MANRFILKNNFSTTLPAGITAAQTAVTVASATGIATPGTGQSLRLTFENPADPSVREIVGVTAVSGNNLTIVRAQEGTAAAIWAAGTKVELRLTAAAANGMLQGLDATGNPRHQSALDIQAERSAGTQIASGLNAVAVGSKCMASGNQSIAIGNEADATDAGGVSIGNKAKTGDPSSISIAPASLSPNSPAVITGRSKYNTVGLGATKRLAFAHAAHYRGYDHIHRNTTDHIWDDDTTTADLATRETTFVSPPLQFGDAGWPGAATSVQHGYVIRVGSFCYMAYCWVGAYPNGGYWGAGNTGAVEPLWPTSHGDFTAVDGAIEWVCLDPSFGYYLPDFARFTPVSVGVIATKSVPGGLVVYPQITAGPSGSPTAWLSATTQSKLTGNMSNHFTDPASTVGAKEFVAAISTAGSDLNCVGHLVIKGYVIESDSA